MILAGHVATQKCETLKYGNLTPLINLEISQSSFFVFFISPKLSDVQWLKQTCLASFVRIAEEILLQRPQKHLQKSQKWLRLPYCSVYGAFFPYFSPLFPSRTCRSNCFELSVSRNTVLLSIFMWRCFEKVGYVVWNIFDTMFNHTYLSVNKSHAVCGLYGFNCIRIRNSNKMFVKQQINSQFKGKSTFKLK